MKRDFSNFQVAAFLPLIAVMLVYATESFVRGAFFNCGGQIFCRDSIPENILDIFITSPTESNLAALTPVLEDGAIPSGEISTARFTANRFASRMTWFVLGEIFLFVSITAFVIASVLTYPQFPHRPFVGTLTGVFLSLLIGFTLFSFPGIHMRIFTIIFEKTIAQDVPSISTFTNVLNSMGNAAAFSLLFASCANLIPAPDDVLPSGLNHLSRRMKNLRLILYTGTTLMIVMLLLKKAIYQWALVYTYQDEQLAEIARNFVPNLLTLDGVFYSMVLAASYLPSALVIQRRATLLPGLPVEAPEKDKVLKDYGLLLSFKESIPRNLVILSPMLVGPIGELVNGAFFK